MVLIRIKWIIKLSLYLTETHQLVMIIGEIISLVLLLLLIFFIRQNAGVAIGKEPNLRELSLPLVSLEQCRAYKVCILLCDYTLYASIWTSLKLCCFIHSHIIHLCLNASIPLVTTLLTEIINEDKIMIISNKWG